MTRSPMPLNSYKLVEDSECLHCRTRRELLEFITEEQIEDLQRGVGTNEILDPVCYLGGREHAYNCLRGPHVMVTF